MQDRLTEAGYKLTTPRRRVVDALYAAREPRTAQEVAETAGTSVASTYRVLALLVSLGLAGEVEDAVEPGANAIPGNCGEARVRRYALCTAAGHHHHFVCRACHGVVEVESDALEEALAATAARTGLHIEQHDVTLRGVCNRCQGQGDEGNQA